MLRNSINFGREVNCSYVDHTVLAPRRIGEVHDRLSRASVSVANKAGMLLHTCLRVEVYSYDAEIAQSTHPLREHAIVVSANRAARRRLTEIAAGVRSELLGEQFVLKQVESAAASLPAEHELRSVVADVVSIARCVRREYGFAAESDYPDLVFSLLKQKCSLRQPATLLVVGSGMLAQGIAVRSAAQYDSVIMVTRSPNRLRKRLPKLTEVRVCGAAHARILMAGAVWDAVIATSNLDEAYRTELIGLVLDPACRQAVDLSCVPLLPDVTDRYEHMYGSQFHELIARQNESMAATAKRVREAIIGIYGGGHD
jgi:glutamyl-tRNA reductase